MTACDLPDLFALLSKGLAFLILPCGMILGFGVTNVANALLLFLQLWPIICNTGNNSILTLFIPLAKPKRPFKSLHSAIAMSIPQGFLSPFERYYVGRRARQ